MFKIAIATVAIAAVLACPPPATAQDQLDLAAAVRTGDVAQVRRLLGKGVDVDTPFGPDSRSALHLAVTSDHRNDDVIELLLAHGADINKRSKTGGAPLKHAIVANNSDAVLLLLAKGANPACVDGQRATALQLAQQLKRSEIVEALVAGGASE